MFATVTTNLRSLCTGAAGLRQIATASLQKRDYSEGTVGRGHRAKALRFERCEVLRQNRRNPELERKARKKELLVPLESVQKEWEQFEGPKHLQTIGNHFHIYKDVFGGEFKPLTFLQVRYGAQQVMRGNILKAKEALHPPDVAFPPLRDTNALWTLVLTNPDGNLVNNHAELLHWMVANIGHDGDVDGHTVVSYLPPVPPKGSGFHRMVFALYRHTHPLELSKLKTGGESWIKERTFSSMEFQTNNAGLQPWSFCFYQTQWDESVHQTYMNTLAYPEPIYELEKELTLRQMKQQEIKQRRQLKFKA